MISSLMLALSLATSPPNSELPAIYPSPQFCELSPQYTQVEDISFIKLKPSDSIAKGNIEDGAIKLPEREGAYAILIREGQLQIYSYDKVGRFYAKQSLMQLLQAPQLQGRQLHALADPLPENFEEGVARQGLLPMGIIADWPDFEQRGMIPAYQTEDWSPQIRREQIAFFGRNKLNIYLWAPVQDPYRQGAELSKLYPEERAKELQELAQMAQEQHVKLVWMMRVDTTWKAPEVEKLEGKIKQLQEMGIGYIALEKGAPRDFAAALQDKLKTQYPQTLKVIELEEAIIPLFPSPLESFAQTINPASINSLQAGLQHAQKSLQSYTTQARIQNNIPSPLQWDLLHKAGLFCLADYWWNKKQSLSLEQITEAFKRLD